VYRGSASYTGQSNSVPLGAAATASSAAAADTTCIAGNMTAGTSTDGDQH
jgi:hypothetical protein